MSLLDEYRPDDSFGEMFDVDRVREHYSLLADRLSEFTVGDLRDKMQLTESTFRNLGITFAVYGTESGMDRTWPIDLIPRIISAADWAIIEDGLIQRTRALNAFLDDIYVGEQGIVNDGVIPEWILKSSDGFKRQAFGVEVRGGARCVVSGIDIVRDGNGVYRVLEDNLRVPSGVSYVMENRAAMKRAFPHLLDQYSVRSVDDYGSMLLRALEWQAPYGMADPTVVVLTPGVHNSAYFEHAFLARRMGVELVEGRDLAVDDHVVYLRTTRGPQKVDVIYRRIDDEFLDPAMFDRQSVVGVPGLLSAVRAGNVAIANPIGNGVADDKAVYTYVPDMIDYYLGEQVILPNVETYVMWDPDQRARALGRMDELVFKPVAEAGGKGIVIGRSATDKELADVRNLIEADPRNYIAQEVVELSTHPTFTGRELAPRHIDLRPFVVSGEKIEVLPGGLTRVALNEGSLIVNSSQGGGSKDTWVLERA